MAKGGGIARVQQKFSAALVTVAALLSLGAGGRDAERKLAINQGLPLARKYLRPANPAEVRTYYNGPWGTAPGGRYERRAAEGQLGSIPLDHTAKPGTRLPWYRRFLNGRA